MPVALTRQMETSGQRWKAEMILSRQESLNLSGSLIAIVEWSCRAVCEVLLDKSWRESDFGDLTPQLAAEDGRGHLGAALCVPPGGEVVSKRSGNSQRKKKREMPRGEVE